MNGAPAIREKPLSVDRILDVTRLVTSVSSSAVIVSLNRRFINMPIILIELMFMKWLNRERGPNQRLSVGRTECNCFPWRPKLKTISFNVWPKQFFQLCLTVMNEFQYKLDWNKLQWLADYSFYWTSGSDEEQENRWLWTATGQPVTYSNWRKNEPNGGTGENGLAIDYDGSSWFDVNKQAKHNAICEV